MLFGTILEISKYINSAMLMNYFKKESILTLIYSFICLLTVYIIGGFFYESSEKMICQVIYGNMVPPPYSIWFNEEHFLQPPILAFLSNLLPNIPIYGLFYLVVLFFYVWACFLYLNRLFQRYGLTGFWLVFVLFTICIGLLAGSLVYVYFMRASILLGALGLLLYIDYWKIEHKRKDIFLFLFFLGCSMRIVSGTMVLVTIGIFAFFYLKSLKEVWRLFSMPFLVLFFCILFTMALKWYFGNVGQQIEQNTEYALMDRQAIKPISAMSSKPDSIRYEAVVSYFLIIDSAQITLPFIKSIVDHDKFSFFSFSKDDIGHFLQTSLPVYSKYLYTLVLLYSLLIVLLFGKTKKVWYFTLGIHLFGWGALVFIGLKISMYPYFFEPWLSMLFLISFTVLFNSPKSIYWAFQKISLACIGTLLFICFWKNTKYVADIEKESNKRASAYMERLNSLPEGKTPMIWIYEMDVFPSDIFARKESAVLQESIHMGIPMMAFFPFVQQRCIDKLGFSYLNWPLMNRMLHNQKDKVCFVMRDEFAEFMPVYYKTLYGLDFNLQKAPNEPEVVSGANVYFLLP